MDYHSTQGGVAILLNASSATETRLSSGFVGHLWLALDSFFDPRMQHGHCRNMYKLCAKVYGDKKGTVRGNIEKWG